MAVSFAPSGMVMMATMACLLLGVVHADCGESPCRGCVPTNSSVRKCSCQDKKEGNKTISVCPSSAGCAQGCNEPGHPVDGSNCQCIGWNGNSSLPDSGPASVFCASSTAWGDWCQHNCPPTCLKPSCGGYSAKCIGFNGNSSLPDYGPASAWCKGNMWGDWCEHKCPSPADRPAGPDVCLKPSCTGGSGYCVGFQGNASQPDLGPASLWCQGNLWGNTCEHNCPTTCQWPSCTGGTGYCIGYEGRASTCSPEKAPATHCKAGHWGNYCQHNCSCPAAPDGSSTCGWEDGSCIVQCPSTCATACTSAGACPTCKDGWSGSKCLVPTGDLKDAATDLLTALYKKLGEDGKLPSGWYNKCGADLGEFFNSLHGGIDSLIHLCFKKGWANMYNANQLLKGAWSAYSGVKAVGELMEDCDVEMDELKTALSKFKSLLDDSFDAWDEFLDKVGADSFMDSLGDLASSLGVEAIEGDSVADLLLLLL